MIGTDPVMLAVVSISFAIIVLGFILKLFKQPYVVAYILVGIIVGPHFLGLVKDQAIISELGSIGLVLMLFFVGMDVHLQKLISGWRISILGTFFQIIASVGLVYLLGSNLGWSLDRIVFLGFVISLSSTSVVLKILEEWNESNTQVGQNVVGILLVQDLAVIPMLAVLAFLSKDGAEPGFIFLQLAGSIALIVFMIWIIRKREIMLPFRAKFKSDHEMQVFYALILCLGMALLTSLFGLSSALGAFLAGIVFASTKEVQWAHEALDSFKVVFVAIFFVSIGMLIDLGFLLKNIIPVSLLVLAVFVVNTVINASILRLLKNSWSESIYAGSLLSQIGEFSFVIASIGVSSGIISTFGYQVTIEVIALTLLLSPGWITLIKAHHQKMLND